MERGGKLIYVLAILMMAFTTNLAAQAIVKKDIPFHIELGMNINTPHKGLMPMGAVIDLNYAIKRFSIHAIATTDFFIPKEGSSTNYNKVTNLGGGIGFELLPREEGLNNIYYLLHGSHSEISECELKNKY